MTKRDFYMPPEELLGAYKKNDMTILDPKIHAIKKRRCRS
jgi:hypothetical protein